MDESASKIKTDVLRLKIKPDILSGLEEENFTAKHLQNFKGMRDFDSDPLEEQRKNRYSQDTDERKYLSHWVVYTVSIWLSAVIYIIANSKEFKLSDSVCIALLTTTTFNILGLAYIVLKGLFGDNEKN